MLFNSLEFILFFGVVTSIYFLLPHKFRWVHLLISSCIFYAAFIPKYLLILFITIIIDYFAGILIENAEGSKRKLYLTLSIISNVGFLAFFKYYNFFADNLNVLFHDIPLLKIALPIGLSFHTFQAMSYTIEVFRGRQSAEKNFGIYALYVMFYPQLVAGPIERPQNLIPQFYQKFDFDYDRVTSGLRLMVWGLLKKVVIADRLAIVVDEIYDHPYAHNSLGFMLATFFFAFQIFYDFSGYSDIAIGAARVMGFKLMTNFNKPYQSKSVSEFWSRWHISLSSWFRDYLYISLGGNRVTIPRWYLNIFIVFLISGLWHGANWTFIVWGALHGFYLIFGRITKRRREKIHTSLGLDNVPFLRTITTFILVAFAWIFFRANNLKDAGHIIKSIFKFNLHFDYNTGLGTTQLIIAFLSIAMLEIIHLIQKRHSLELWFTQRPKIFRWTVYYCIIMVFICFGIYENKQFIYFQF